MKEPLRYLCLVTLTLSILLAGCSSLGQVPTGIPEISPKLVNTISLPTPQIATPARHEEARITPTLDEHYLTNPGIGWQDGPEPYGIMNFPETVAYANRREIAWSELNPASGVYNWQALETQMKRAVEAGEQYSFRVYTYVGEGYDGNKIPEWVVDEGAQFLPSGEPDYSNCIYQAEWGKFVNALIRKYDGNADIAFIDISGYGNFNEWSWQDDQTQWDNQWDEEYSNGTPSKEAFQTLDGQARRRLVDMFIGGSFTGHACRMPDGTMAYLDYSYAGFQKTQLVMPYAGIVQSSQYVISRRNDVGFRHDCLGREGQHVYEKIGDVIRRTWMNAPVVYELCKPSETDVGDATWLLQKTHASIVHNNQWSYSRKKLEDMLLPVGYRYFLKDADIEITGRSITVEMEWQNLGLAPNYPKMGQNFQLYFCIVDGTGKLVFKDPISEDISTWLPPDSLQDEPSVYQVSYERQIPSSLAPGYYQVGVSVIDLRTGLPIQLAFEGRDASGVYILFQTEIE